MSCPDADPEAPLRELRKRADELGYRVVPDLPIREPGQTLVLSTLTMNAIQMEATRAHVLHGRNSMLGPDQTDERRLAVLAEEFGEVAKEINEAEIRLTKAGAGPETPLELFMDRDAIVKELIQTAAMAASWVEALEGDFSAR